MSACYRLDKLTSHSHILLVYTQIEGATTKLSIRLQSVRFHFPGCYYIQQDLLTPNTGLHLVSESFLLFSEATSFKSQTTLLNIINAQLFLAHGETKWQKAKFRFHLFAIATDSKFQKLIALFSRTLVRTCLFQRFLDHATNFVIPKNITHIEHFQGKKSNSAFTYDLMPDVPSKPAY